MTKSAIKHKIIDSLIKEGWLPDEAERRVEDCWWIIEEYKKYIDWGEL